MKKKRLLLWLIPAAVIVVGVILWLTSPLPMWLMLDKNAEVACAYVDINTPLSAAEDDEITPFCTYDPEKLAEIEKVIRSTRCHYAGRFVDIKRTDKPLLFVSITGTDDGEDFNIGFSLDDRGYIYIHLRYLGPYHHDEVIGGMRCRTSDALYNYMAGLLPT